MIVAKWWSHFFHIHFWPKPDWDTFKACENEQISCLGEYFFPYIETYSIKVHWQDFQSEVGNKNKYSILKRQFNKNVNRVDTETYSKPK